MKAIVLQLGARISVDRTQHRTILTIGEHVFELSNFHFQALVDATQDSSDLAADLESSEEENEILESRIEELKKDLAKSQATNERIKKDAKDFNEKLIKILEGES